MSLPPGATLVSGQPQMSLPPGANLISGGAQSNQAPAKPSFWRTVYDRSSIGAIQKLAGRLSDWAGSKADTAQTENLDKVATGDKGIAMQSYSPRAGYDLLSHTAGLVNSFLDPTNLAITGGVALANTNPFTGIPVDAALVAHGGYNVVKNAPAAFSGNPDAVQNMLLSGSEMAGGAAGTGAQVKAVPRVAQNIVNAQGVVRKVGSAAGVPLSTDVPTGPKAAAATPARAAAQAPQAAVAEAPVQEFGEEGGPARPQAPGAPTGRMAQVLGVTDPPPNQLLTKAIKPLASNTGWDAALAKAAPDMKAVEGELGHPIAGVDDALSAVNVAKKGIWKQYADKLQAAKEAYPDAPTLSTIDGNEIADAMMQSIDARTQLQNPGLVERIQKVADTYRRPMGLDETEDFLQSANNDLHGYYAKNKVGRQVAERDPETGHVVAEADQLRDSLYSTLDNLTGPGAADLKARYGALSNVENELLRRKNVSARQQPDSLAEQLGMARSFGKIAVGTLRASPTAMLEGVQSLAAAKFLKARGLTDNMITRAFQALGSQGPGATPMPATPPATTPAAAGAAAGATPDAQTTDSSAPENTGAALLQRHGAIGVRQALNNPVAQDILQTVAPNTAAFLIKRAGIADKTSFGNRGRAI